MLGYWFQKEWNILSEDEGWIESQAPDVENFQ